MRSLVLTLILCVGLSGLAGCGGDDDGDGADTSGAEGIRAAYTGALDPNDVADQFGLNAVGADVRTLNEDSAVVALLRRGDADVGNISYEAAIRAIQAGVPLSIFYVSQTTPEFTVVAESEIADFTELDGLTAAYNCRGCSDEILWRGLMREYAPEADVEFVVLDSSPARVRALLSDEFDATDLEVLSVAEVMKQAPGEYHTLGGWRDLTGNAQSVIATVWVTLTENLEEDRDRYLALAEELQRGYDQFYDDKEAWIDLATETLPDVDASLFSDAYDVYREQRMYPQSGTAPLTPSQQEEMDTFLFNLETFEERPTGEGIAYDIIDEVAGVAEGGS